MSTVIDFATGKVLNNEDQFEIKKDVWVIRPKTKLEYLTLCKRFLPVQTYKEILVAIIDREFYINSHEYIRKIVDAYYNYPE